MFSLSNCMQVNRVAIKIGAKVDGSLFSSNKINHFLHVQVCLIIYNPFNHFQHFKGIFYSSGRVLILVVVFQGLYKNWMF